MSIIACHNRSNCQDIMDTIKTNEQNRHKVYNLLE